MRTKPQKITRKLSEKSRVFCEDSSPSYNAIRKEKYNGIPLILGGISYTRIGNDMILNHKTNKIERYETRI